MSIPGSASPLFFTAAADAAAAGPIKSVRFNSADTAFLSRTPSSAGNRRTFTFSCWIKFLKDDGEQQLFNAGTNTDYIRLNGNRTAWIKINSAYYGPSAVFRDYGAWYHWVIAVDTTQSTASDRVKMWVNGVQQTLNQGSGFPSQNASSNFNNTTKHAIGIQNWNNASPSDFYLAANYWIDGQALAATDFGEYDSNNVWQPKEYSGTFGTNGFHLFDFANESGIGNDSSGNDNDFTVNNLSSTAGAGNDVLFDVPTNGDSSDDTGAGGEVSGNYATLNSNITGTYISRSTLSNGNLQFVNTQYSTLPSTIAMSSGKWYCEGTLDALASASNQVWAGLLRADAPNNAYEYFQGNNPTRGVHFWGDNTGLNRSQSYGASYATAGTVIGIAFDADAGSCTWYINGSSQGASTYNIVQGEAYYFSFGAYTNGAWTVNFGQRSWAYSAPSGYKPLCTTLLPTPTIADGSDYFDTKIWTGTGSTRSITGYEFSPDFVWIKNRTDSSHHHLYDIVRGVEKRLRSNDTNAEDDFGSSNSGQSLTSFNSDGFTIGDFNGINGSSDSIVGWAWDGGSSTVSNTDGSITSSVRANQTAGFSIVSYTGTGSAATVGHGLNAAPELLIIKNRDGAHQWPVYFKVLGAGNKLQLNDTAASASTSHFNSTDPTSSVFSVGGTSSANNNNEDHIAYCFAPVSGYSAFGSLNTNNNANGPFVYTGFRPAFIIYRYSNTTGNWAIFDSKRNTYNVMDDYLFANTNAAEASSSNIDFLSNGFKFRISLPSGNTIVYACFAENPFQANGGLAR